MSASIVISHEFLAELQEKREKESGRRRKTVEVEEGEKEKGK